MNHTGVYSGKNIRSMVWHQQDDFGALVNAIQGFEYFNYINSRPRHTDLILYNIIKLRGDFKNLSRPSLSLSMLCGMFPDMACADIRDRVYALLSLVSPREMSEFPVHADYSKSASDLFLELYHRACLKAGELATTLPTARKPNKRSTHNFRHSYSFHTKRHKRTGITSDIRNPEMSERRELLNKTMSDLAEPLEVDGADENYVLTVILQNII
jgi:hypothetical protein